MELPIAKQKVKYTADQYIQLQTRFFFLLFPIYRYTQQPHLCTQPHTFKASILLYFPFPLCRCRVKVACVFFFIANMGG